MSDSSDHDEIFGDDSDASDDSQNEREVANDTAPTYIETEEFKSFVDVNKINLNK
jgi:hypothetical protein